MSDRLNLTAMYGKAGYKKADVVYPAIIADLRVINICGPISMLKKRELICV
ncbi:hypothetical protein [Borrelia turcica]|uniref:hypothetical protein n=1 Tax=Borrelia turcica TaxID=229155 RepID=UPI001374A8D9|nr:hypothetical protein [Borrelia turcica]